MAGGSTEWRGRSVVSKVVTLLDAFDAAAPELTLGELARRTGLPLSTAYRLVSELVDWGGLERVPGGGYRIGVHLGEIGALAPHARAACGRRPAAPAARSADGGPGHTGAVTEPRLQSRPEAPGAAPATRRAAVLGMPVEHSLSPVLHHAAYAALGLSGWRYDRYAVDEPGLRAFVDGLGPEWAGLSLTMPLKREVLAVADEVDPDAAAIGAANTLVRRAGAWYAANTDVVGIVETLREAGVTTVGRAVVLGAGGTAQAALAALRRLGETAPTVLVRDPARAGALRATAGRLGLTPRIVGGFPDTAEAAVPGADVVISTLPAGAADALARRVWDPATVVLDVIYAPWPTALAAAADAAGCRVAGGLEVLLHQAVGQVELMTGRPGPTAAMRAALSAAAGDRAAAQDTSRTGPAASGTARGGTVPEAR